MIIALCEVVSSTKPTLCSIPITLHLTTKKQQILKLIWLQNSIILSTLALQPHKAGQGSF